MGTHPADPSWEAVRGLFHAALEQPPETRLEWLAGASAGDAALRQEVESLLRREMEAGGFLEPPSSVEPGEFLDVSQASRLIGKRLGPYRLLGLLGRGAMGIVYDAEQENPRRRVALKVMRSLPYLDELTPRLFQREVQALARMEHHGIATIHDAGRTDDGWCYFAMERIDGLPMTLYALEHRLSLRERLELFARVCETVHYAHQRGVIHRDLKPSNILVTAEGQPKVLDFGLARITEAGAENATQITQPGSFHGTLAYASPEQMRCRPDEIDARSDVYSLGMVLYELLTGKLPYGVAGLSVSEAARTICELTPAPAGLVDRALRGDLDTILSKALAKEPEQRYPSAAALGEDVLRYLGSQPILAHPPTAAYQIRKLVSRHRVAATLTAALALVLIVSAAVTGWLAFRFAGQRDLARSAEEQAAHAKDSAEEFAGFLERLFENASPGAGGEKELSLRSVLDDGYARLDEIQDELVKARLMTVMGRVYVDLGDFERGRELIGSALEVRRRELGDRDPETLVSLRAFVNLLIRARELDAADSAASELLEIRRQVYGEEHALVADAWELRGEGRYYARDLPAAAEYFQHNLEICRRLHSGASGDTAAALDNMGRTLCEMGKTGEGEALLREGLAMRREVGDPHGIDPALEGLALLVYGRDKKEAEAFLEEELSLARSLYHRRHPRLAWILTNYAFVVSDNHGPPAAEPYYAEAVEVCRRGDATEDLLARCLDMYGMCLLDQGRGSEAAVPLEECAGIYRKLYGPDDRRSVAAREQADQALGRPREPSAGSAASK